MYTCTHTHIHTYEQAAWERPSFGCLGASSRPKAREFTPGCYERQVGRRRAWCCEWESTKTAGCCESQVGRGTVQGTGPREAGDGRGSTARASCEHASCEHAGCEPRLAAAADAGPAAADAAVDLGDAAADLALTSDAAVDLGDAAADLALTSDAAVDLGDAAVDLALTSISEMQQLTLL